MPNTISRNGRSNATQQTQTPARSSTTRQAQTSQPATNQGWVRGAGTTGGIGGASIDSAAAKKAFWHSPYTTADAKAAQKAFGLRTLDQGKELIGRAVITRNEGPLEQKGISRARYDDHDCTVAFKRSPYTEADAKAALKKLPFLENLAQAKEYIGLKIVNKNESILEEVGVTRSEFDSQDMLAAFKRGGYSAADVAQAKKKFDFLKDSSTQEVKEYMGLKVLNNYTEMLSAKGITANRDRHEIP